MHIFQFLSPAIEDSAFTPTLIVSVVAFVVCFLATFRTASNPDVNPEPLIVLGIVIAVVSFAILLADAYKMILTGSPAAAELVTLLTYMLTFVGISGALGASLTRIFRKK